MSNMIRDAVMGKEATLAAIEDLKATFESGEISCAALRVFNADGTWEDLAIGGDDDEKAKALAEMRKLYGGPTESDELAAVGVFASAKWRHRLSENPSSEARRS